MSVLLVLFVVVLALAAVLTVLDHRDLPAQGSEARGWWPGARRPS